MQGVRLHALFAALVTVGIAFAFVSHARGEWIWDDVYLIEKNRQLVDDGGLRSVVTRDLWGGATGASTQLYHPAPMVVLWLEAHLLGVAVGPMRLANVLVHVANGALLYAVCRRRFALSATATRLAVVVFLLHPSTTEPVMWLTGLHDLLGVAFTLAACLVFPLWRPVAQWWPRAAGTALLSGLAFLSKELFIVVPALLALDLVLPWLRGERPRRSAASALALVAFADGLVVALRSHLGIGTGSDQVGARLVDHVRTAGTIYAHYGLQLGTFGNGRTTHVWVPLAASAAAIVLGIAVALVTGLAAGMRRGHESAALALRGALWMGISLAPNIVALPAIGMFGNRYAYLPLVGFGLMLGAAYEAVMRRASSSAPKVEPLLHVLPSILALCFALPTAGEATAWLSGVTLFGADVERAPDDPRALYHYGHALYRRQGCREALPYYQKAIVADPTYQRAWHNVAGCLINEREFAAAVPPAEQALALAPNDARAEFNLGIALASSGRLDDGILHLERAHALDPSHLGAKDELARARAARGG